MLFNSYPFLFFFLPLVWLGFQLLRPFGWLRQAGWLVVASLFFYGWWNPVYLLLILSSILVNFLTGRALSRKPDGSPGRRSLLWLGVGFNLALLGFFKYGGFFAVNVRSMMGVDLHLPDIVLPLAISFFTFQQIAFLVDAHRRLSKEYSFVNYCLFVTFFPQLIAGPIVHHGELLPQFEKEGRGRRLDMDIAVGLTIFTFGLFKKVVLADGIAAYANPVFGAAGHGITLTFGEAWAGALAYTFQLYFDFSGYSDMAIGLARLFGIRLPLNFDSPYKATNMIQFWRRWHMTLSRFLRDYLYIPLGGNRKGTSRRQVNVFVTMLLGGLWHGAAWTFVAWGALHGLYLATNHAWLSLKGRLGFPPSALGRLGAVSAWATTFVAVVVGWVFFRAERFGPAWSQIRSMFGFNGISLLRRWAPARGAPLDGWLRFDGAFHNQLADWGSGLTWIIVLMAISVLAPNTQEVLRRYRPALKTYRQASVWSLPLVWRPTWVWGVVLAVLLLFTIGEMTQISEFLYYQF